MKHHHPENSELRIALTTTDEGEHQVFLHTFQNAGIPIDLTIFDKAEEALDLLLQLPDRFDLVVIDTLLPNMPGIELCRELLTHDLPLPIVLLVETGSESIAIEAIHAGVTRYVMKDHDRRYTKLLPVLLPDVALRSREQRGYQQITDLLWASEERYRRLIETTPHGIEECNTSGIITFANAAYHTMFGYEDGELLGTTIWNKLASEEQCHEERQHFLRLVDEQPPPHTLYTQNLTKDGRTINVQIDWNYRYDQQQQLIGFIAVLTDITERKRAEASLREQNRELALLNDMNSLLQACRKEEETYHVINNVCKQLFPGDSGFLFMMDDSRTMLQEVIYWGSPPPEPRFFDVEECWAMRLGKIHLISQPESGLLCPHLSAFPDNGYLCAPITASGGTLGMFHLCFSEYSSQYSPGERAQMQEMKQVIVERLAEQYSLSLVNLRLRETLRLESIRDPLTGLYNRRHMEASLTREVLRAKRRKTPVAIIMIDIDHFKPFNDTYGHEAGDIVLRELATLVRQSIRGEDIACRYGGEEFLLILPDARLEIAQKRAEELRARGSELQIAYQGHVLTITVSAGVAVFPDHSTEMNAVVKAADTALYQAKQSGRNQVIVAPLAQRKEQ